MELKTDQKKKESRPESGLLRWSADLKQCSFLTCVYAMAQIFHTIDTNGQWEVL